jgi:hypothetical protein
VIEWGQANSKKKPQRFVPFKAPTSCFNLDQKTLPGVSVDLCMYILPHFQNHPRGPPEQSIPRRPHGGYPAEYRKPTVGEAVVNVVSGINRGNEDE